jgi:transcriptional regulator with XRE-family HTH domain
VRRRELGTLLRNLRIERGWTVEEVAGRLLVSSSKISRLETGRRGASPRDIRDFCDLYGVTDDLRVRLAELAAEGKQRAWWQPLALPYSTYIGLETEAVSIQDYGLAIVPGLLQTEDYAREVVRAAVSSWPPDIVEQRVAGRLTRQQLLESDNSPRFETVIDESVLHRVVGNPGVMRDQLERLLIASELPNVAIQVLEFGAGALPAGNNKFIVLRFGTLEMPTVVFVEGLTGDLYLEDPGDVKVYTDTFTRLQDMALAASETRDKLQAIINRYSRNIDQASPLEPQT